MSNSFTSRVPHLGGALKLHVLDLGKLRLDRNLIVADSADADSDVSSRLIDIPVSAYLIEHPDGNILFDTGCPTDWETRWPAGAKQEFTVLGGEECMLPARLEALGIGPNQIKHVVLSHLHCDHAGCVEYFRKSQIIVHADEFAGAYAHFGLQSKSSPYIIGDLEKWSRLSLDWRLIGRNERHRELVKGVRLLNFGSGHSYGMLGLGVSLRSRLDVLLVSDACYGKESYGPPVREPGILLDSVGFASTIENIRAMADNSGSEVWFGHDSEQFAALITSGNGWYE